MFFHGLSGPYSLPIKANTRLHGSSPAIRKLRLRVLKFRASARLLSGIFSLDLQMLSQLEFSIQGPCNPPTAHPSILVTPRKDCRSLSGKGTTHPDRPPH